MKIKILLTISTLLLLCSACRSQSNTGTPTVLETNTPPTINSTSTNTTDEVIKISTTTSEPSFTPSPEQPTITPSPTLEIQPVDATCIENSNVRSWPGKGGDNLGGLIFGNPVKVLARNISGVWYLIGYENSPMRRGWVRSSAIYLRGYADLLPIAIEDQNHNLSFLAPTRWTIFGTPLPLPTLSGGTTLTSATISQSADVRVCPTISCMIIAYLHPGDKIILNGKEGQNEWARFIYPSGPDGVGWIASNFASPEPGAFSDLPSYDELGNLITPEPPTSTPDPNMSPTPTTTATSTQAGPLAEITGPTSVYSLQSSLSSVIGTLQTGDKINITSESLNHIWFEVQYPANTTGRGFISTKYIRKLGDFRYLHYTDSNGTPVPTP